MEDEELSIDEIRLWKVETLKDFFRKRGLKISYRKDELVALVFAAKQMPEQFKVTSQEEKDASKEKQYRDLLTIGDKNIPDPLKLEEGWEKENIAVTKWPQTMAFDIGKYLSNIDNVPLKSRLISDYKEGKGYSYFASGWLKEIEYHPISRESDKCFLRAKCRPSQSINNLPWKVWVCIGKRSGEVHSAYCSCFAGYGSTCNHIAAVLFKVDFAWRNGLTNPACTSRECGWSSFGAKQQVQPKRIAEMTWSKPQFSKRGRTSAGINPRIRQLFSPTRSSKQQKAAPTFENLQQNLQPLFEDACVFAGSALHREESSGSIQFLPHEDINVAFTEEVETSQPTSMMALAAMAGATSDFLLAIPVYSTSTIKDIEERTKGQADNPDWFAERQGRITGSVVHLIVTWSRRLKSGEQLDNTLLLKRILYDKLNPDIPALKYGREMEGEARDKYIFVMKEEGHHIMVKECGLFVHPEHVYVGASPDGLIHCECCGAGVLEIKCPLKTSYTAPTTTNLDYIEEVDGVLSLKKSHSYYSQVILEMGVTNTKFCDFFVYSRHGYLKIRTLWDEERWMEMLELCDNFFKNFMAKELISKDIFNKISLE